MKTVLFGLLFLSDYFISMMITAALLYNTIKKPNYGSIADLRNPSNWIKLPLILAGPIALSVILHIHFGNSLFKWQFILIPFLGVVSALQMPNHKR